jgi:serine/threonine protein kinase/Tfp pilus assembly protein PilF
MIGQTISHYKIVDKLGEGGMGIIYKAEDLKLKRIVALKVLPESFTHDEESKRRFTNEARTASVLQHNNICTIHNIEETEKGQFFIVMDCYEGESLKEKISRRQMNLEEVLNITIQIANGLSKAHEKGIIHRDIKPANIFITSDGTVKILDFGLAKLAGVQTKLTKSGLTLGTVSYMSPEQIRGDEVDNRTDIWSLGVVLYEMLTGSPPFKGEYEQGVMYSIINEEPEFLTRVRSQVPVKMEQVIETALKKNRDKRFQNIEEMLNELQNIFVESKSGNLEKRSSFLPISRRQRRIAYRILIAIFAVIVIISIYLWQSQNVETKSASIALMPLKNITSNVEQEWLTDGITDALITSLAQISGLRVISRSSIMRYKDSDKSPPEIAEELGVSYLIEGSVVRAGDRIKITTRLIDAPSNNYLWAEEYQRDFKDILLLQSEIASTIAGHIQVKLTPYEQELLSNKPQVDPQAYDAYLKGNFYWYKLTPQSLETALKYYELAVEIDSGYALGYAGIALVWGGRAQFDYEPYSMAIKKIRPAVKKAHELGGNLAEVQYTVAVINTWSEWNWEQARDGFKKAIKINPNYAEARAYYSHLLFILNEPDEAMNQIEQALKLDPFNSLFQGLYAMDLIFLGRYDDAINRLEEIHRTNPRELLIHHGLMRAYHQKQMYQKALEIWRLALEVREDKEAVDVLDKGNAEGGYLTALQKVAELQIKRSKTQLIAPTRIAMLYARAGMYEEALDWLEKAYEAHDPNMPYLNIDPTFDKIRDYPRFKMLIRKMGL